MITRMLQKAVAAKPNKAAIVQGTRRVSYAELEEMSARCAGGLRAAGVGTGDVVAVALPNCPEFVACLFACARLRCIMVPLNPQFTADELGRLAQDARAKLFITESARTVVPANTPVATTNKLIAAEPQPRPDDEFAGPVLYLYTSGSTDVYKRLCCTQRNLYYEAFNFVETVGLTEENTILCTIPLFHSYGLGNCLLDAAYTGATLVLLDAKSAPFATCCREVFELVRAEDVQVYPGVPYQYRILAQEAPANADLGNLKYCISSGDVLPQRVYEAFFARFGLPIRSLYGSTEAGSIAMNTEPDAQVSFGSLGPPLENVALLIRDNAGRDLPVGEPGHIWVKSPVIPPTGYDNRPDLTGQVFRDGFYNTGDLGLLDARGHLVLTGRKQSFVEVGGHKVDLGEVEEVLQSHPRVREAAVLGVDVPPLGTLVKANVVMDGLCEEAELVMHCRKRLAPFKVPRLVEFHDTLPRSPIGKVLKSALGGATGYLENTRPADFARAWQAAVSEPRARQLELLAARIQEQAALSLQCAPSAIPRAASFREMGFDSLRAVELHHRVLLMTGVTMSITTLWNHPSVEELAAEVWVRLNPEPNTPRAALDENGSAPYGAGGLNQLLDELDAMPDAVIDAALRGR